MSDRLWNQDVSVLKLMRQARDVYRDALLVALAEAGCDDIPRNGAFVLANLDHSTPEPAFSPQANVVASLGLSKQTGSQLIDTLVLREYLERRNDPEDRRRMGVRLTAADVPQRWRSEKPAMPSMSRLPVWLLPMSCTGSKPPWRHMEYFVIDRSTSGQHATEWAECGGNKTLRSASSRSSFRLFRFPCRSAISSTSCDADDRSVRIVLTTRDAPPAKGTPLLAELPLRLAGAA